MNKKKIIIISCILIMVIIAILLIKPQIEKTNAADVKYEDVVPEITFSAFWASNKDGKWTDFSIAKEITKITGVALELVYAGSNPDVTAKSMLASNNFPDLMLSINNYTVSMYADANALVAMDDYIYNRSKNIKEIFGDDLSKMRFDNNGAIYGVNRQYQSVPSHSNGIFNVQYELLKEFDYPVINTLDELYELLFEYKKKYPQINNEPTIGLSFYTHSYGFNLSIANAAAQSGGYQNDGLFCVDDDTNVQYSITTDAAKQYLKWLNKLYLSELLDNSALMQTKETLTKKVKTGQVLAIAAEQWDIVSLNSEIRSNGQSHRAYLPLPLTLNKEIESKASRYDPLGSWKTVVTTNCNDPEKAFEFYDMMWSEEMQILCNWGIEGVHYDIVDDVRVANSEIYETMSSDPLWTNNTGLMLFYFWSNGVNVKGSDGQYLFPVGNIEDTIKSYDEETKKILGHYNIELLTGLFPEREPSKRPFAWKLVLPSDSEGALAEEKMETLRRKIVPQIVFSKDEKEFEMHWRELIDTANEIGIHKRESEIYEKLIQWINLD